MPFKVKIVCKDCSIEKDVSEYHVQPKRNYGIDTVCKSCTSAKQLIYRQKNKDRIAQYRKDNRERDRETYRLYALNNSEKLKAYSHGYYLEHREELKVKAFLREEAKK